MKTKTLKKDKVNIVTLGCSKNLVDSQVMLTQLRGNQVEATHEAEEDDANVVIINTCGFIDNAKQESVQLDEKERKLIQMGDEINRLSAFEKESRYKDKIIASLRQKCQNQA